MTRFSHWIFDMDGTIIDSSQLYELSIRKILADFDIRPSDDDMARAYKFFNPQDYFSTFQLTESQVLSAVNKLLLLNHESANQTPAFHGIEELFEFLKSKAVRLSVWTGRDLRSAQVKAISVNWEGKGHLQGQGSSFMHFERVNDLRAWVETLYTS